jgi:ADP-ribosylglycohydrolase
MKDILLAGAIGDAAGYAIEFKKIDKIRAMFGPNGLRLQDVHPSYISVVSDDTQMTLFALEALHRMPENNWHPKIIWEAYKQWYHTQDDTEFDCLTSPLAQFPQLRVQRAPGITCLGSLSKDDEYVSRVGKPINDSKGCGGIMRAAPFGFVDNFEDAYIMGREQAVLTHGHPSGYHSAAAFSALIHLAVYSDKYYDRRYNQDPKNFKQAINTVRSWLREDYQSEETVAAIDLALETAKNSTGDYYNEVSKVGQGWVGEEALAVAIYAFLVADSFEEAVNISINHDGDSDSTGTLAAQLWAAYEGMPEKYRDWDKRLDIAEPFAFVTNEENYVKL